VIKDLRARNISTNFVPPERMSTRPMTWSKQAPRWRRWLRDQAFSLRHRWR
jgi:hypothetical protein